jgi:hypothetical protein
LLTPKRAAEETARASAEEGHLSENILERAPALRNKEFSRPQSKWPRKYEPNRWAVHLGLPACQSGRHQEFRYERKAWLFVFLSVIYLTTLLKLR